MQNCGENTENYSGWKQALQELQQFQSQEQLCKVEMTIKKLLCIFWQHGTGPWRLQNGNNAVNLKVAIASISLKKKKDLVIKSLQLRIKQGIFAFFFIYFLPYGCEKMEIRSRHRQIWQAFESKCLRKLMMLNEINFLKKWKFIRTQQSRSQKLKPKEMVWRIC